MRNLRQKEKKYPKKMTHKLVTIENCCSDYLMDIAQNFSNKKLNFQFCKIIKGISNNSVSTIPSITINGSKSINKKANYPPRMFVNKKTKL